MRLLYLISARQSRRSENFDRCIVLCGIYPDFTAAVMTFWIYRSVMQPLRKMQIAAKNIKEGNLDFELKPVADERWDGLARTWRK